MNHTIMHIKLSNN